VQVQLEKREIARKLQAKINAMQGLGKLPFSTSKSALAPFNRAFPDGVFPMGSLHEFVSYEPFESASTSGFMTAMIGKFIKDGGICIWIAAERNIFPSTLKQFGLEPDRVIFVCTANPKEALWITEEALKCEALTAVISEIKELSFTVSRRFQLAIEHSGVTGLIHRHRPISENSLACTARWKVTPLASKSDDGLPGVGYSAWDIRLLKVKNGKPDSWQVSWQDDFIPLESPNQDMPSIERYAG
jgi:protein ImuA